MSDSPTLAQMVDTALDAAGRMGGNVGPVRMGAAMEAVLASLDVYECRWRLRNHTGRLCGYAQRGAGICPYDHGEDVELVRLGGTP